MSAAGLIIEEHFLDGFGRPEGGITCGRGFTISWQRGPLGRGADRKEPNGAFVEDVIQAVIGRIEHYQGTRFLCAENADALRHLRLALGRLQDRTREREARAVEGTHAT